jgi:hypothetical protein
MADQREKGRLIKSLKAQRLMFEVALEQVPPNRWQESGVVGLWSCQDLLAHVTTWDQRGTSWLLAVGAGQTPEIPLPGHTWADLDALNEATYQAHKTDSAEAVLAAFEASFPPLLAAAEAISAQAYLGECHYQQAGNLVRIATARLVAWRYYHYIEHAKHISLWLHNNKNQHPQQRV